jgi:hypothetical protein
VGQAFHLLLLKRQLWQVESHPSQTIPEKLNIYAALPSLRKSYKPVIPAFLIDRFVAAFRYQSKGYRLASRTSCRGRRLTYQILYRNYGISKKQTFSLTLPCNWSLRE